MEELIQINDLCCQCGFFYNDKSWINNGYNCNHPDCDEREDDDKGNSIGRCHTWSCPIATEADLHDLKRLDESLYQEYKDSADKEGHIDSDWMVFERIEGEENVIRT